MCRPMRNRCLYDVSKKPLEFFHSILAFNGFPHPEIFSMSLVRVFASSVCQLTLLIRRLKRAWVSIYYHIKSYH